jgi:hypothetical protein
MTVISPRRGARWGCAAVAAMVVGLSGCVPSEPTVGEYVDSALAYLDQGYFADSDAWRDARRNAVADLADAKDTADTYDILSRLVGVAGGPHSRFLTPEQAQAATTAFDEGDDSWKPSVTVAGNIGTVHLPAYGSDDADLDQEYISAANRGILEAPAVCGWVVDLSGDSGGDMFVRLAALAPLLRDGPLLDFVDREGDHEHIELADGTVTLDGEAIDSATPEKAAPTPLAIVQSRTTASAGEGVVVAFRGQPQATTFGQYTAGFSSANGSMTLADGAMIILTDAVFADTSGQVYGGAIAPDVRVSLSNSHLNTETPLSWLSAQC